MAEERIVIHNATKKWLKCIDVLDSRNTPIVGATKGEWIAPSSETIVLNDNATEKITIIIGGSEDE
jgi:hypothetical protein